jgi:hypothetical protein
MNEIKYVQIQTSPVIRDGYITIEMAIETDGKKSFVQKTVYQDDFISHFDQIFDICKNQLKKEVLTTK